jgi:heme exporter protein CcmB
MKPLLKYLGHVLEHLRKDLRLEWRSRDAINGMLFFALLVVVVFSLAFDPTGYPSTTRQISGGILWVALLFASVTALNLSWAREQRNQVLEAQRMAPSPASALFLGKAIANLLFVLLPALLMMVQATTGVLTSELDPIQIRSWITQLAGYDIIYTTVCILLFETVLNAE